MSTFLLRAAMTLLCGTAILSFAACGGGSLSPTPGPRIPGSQLPGASGTSPLIYLPRQSGGAITAYPVDSVGSPSPAITIVGNHTTLGKVEAAAFDSHANLYATNITGCVTCIVVFAAGASGNATPIGTTCRTAAASDGYEGITIDSSDTIYVANIDLNTISVFTTNGSGQLTLTRTIGGSLTELAGPLGVALDSTGRLYVTNFNGDSITVYAAGASGNVAPVAKLSGDQTFLHEPAGIVLDASNNIFVGNGDPNDPSRASAISFTAGANGNVAPATIIDGTNTGLGGGVPVGVALSGGELFADQFFGVFIFATSANGNVPPTRNFNVFDPAFGDVGLPAIH